MAKRRPAPEVDDGASHFFSVYQTYPPNFDWDIPEQVLLLVRWIVACLGSHEPFYTFYYKPTVCTTVSVLFLCTNRYGQGRCDHFGGGKALRWFSVGEIIR
jgi:hypothetical protein